MNSVVGSLLFMCWLVCLRVRCLFFVFVACLLVYWCVCSFDYLLVYLLARFFDCLFVCLVVYLIACCFVWLVVCLIVCSVCVLACLLVCYFFGSFARSCVRLHDCLFVC